MFTDFPFSSPEQSGVEEHYSRARWLLGLADQTSDPTERFRFLILAIYPARAIAELMLEATEKQGLKNYTDDDPKKARIQFEEQNLVNLPYYHLIEKIRIHDFHRFGCLPPDPKFVSKFFGGPMKATARGRGGYVQAQLTSEGLEVKKSGNSLLKEYRSLLSENGEFFDDTSKKYLSLESILSEYLDAIDGLIAEFRQLLCGCDKG